MKRLTLKDLLARIEALEEKVKSLEPPAVLSAAIGFEVSPQPEESTIPYRRR